MNISNPRLFLPLRRRRHIGRRAPADEPAGTIDLNLPAKGLRAVLYQGRLDTRNEFLRAFDGDNRVCGRCHHRGCVGALLSLNDGMHPGLRATPAVPPHWEWEPDQGRTVWREERMHNANAGTLVLQACRRCGAIELFDISAIDCEWDVDQISLLEAPPDYPPEHLNPLAQPDLRP